MSIRFDPLRACLPDLDDAAPSAVVMVRIAEPRMCPVLGAPLERALSRLVGGTPVVLVHRGVDGDVRMYGHACFEQAPIGLDLDAHPCVEFELPVDDEPAPSLLLAA
jgi:hypothetical protein